MPLFHDAIFMFYLAWCCLSFISCYAAFASIYWCRRYWCFAIFRFLSRFFAAIFTICFRYDWCASCLAFAMPCAARCQRHARDDFAMPRSACFRLIALFYATYYMSFMILRRFHADDVDITLHCRLRHYYATLTPLRCFIFAPPCRCRRAMLMFISLIFSCLYAALFSIIFIFAMLTQHAFREAAMSFSLPMLLRLHVDYFFSDALLMLLLRFSLRVYARFRLLPRFSLLFFDDAPPYYFRLRCFIYNVYFACRRFELFLIIFAPLLLMLMLPLSILMLFIDISLFAMPLIDIIIYYLFIIDWLIIPLLLLLAIILICWCLSFFWLFIFADISIVFAPGMFDFRHYALMPLLPCHYYLFIVDTMMPFSPFSFSIFHYFSPLLSSPLIFAFFHFRRHAADYVFALFTLSLIFLITLMIFDFDFHAFIFAITLMPPLLISRYYAATFFLYCFLYAAAFAFDFADCLLALSSLSLLRRLLISLCCFYALIRHCFDMLFICFFFTRWSYFHCHCCHTADDTLILFLSLLIFFRHYFAALIISYISPDTLFLLSFFEIAAFRQLIIFSSYAFADLPMFSIIFAYSLIIIFFWCFFACRRFHFWLFLLSLFAMLPRHYYFISLLRASARACQRAQHAAVLLMAPPRAAYARQRERRAIWCAYACCASLLPLLFWYARDMILMLPCQLLCRDAILRCRCHLRCLLLIFRHWYFRHYWAIIDYFLMILIIFFFRFAFWCFLFIFFRLRWLRFRFAASMPPFFSLCFLLWFLLLLSRFLRRFLWMFFCWCCFFAAATLICWCYWLRCCCLLPLFRRHTRYWCATCASAIFFVALIFIHCLPDAIIRCFRAAQRARALPCWLLLYAVYLIRIHVAQFLFFFFHYADISRLIISFFLSLSFDISSRHFDTYFILLSLLWCFSFSARFLPIMLFFFSSSPIIFAISAFSLGELLSMLIDSFRIILMMPLLRFIDMLFYLLLLFIVFDVFAAFADMLRHIAWCRYCWCFRFSFADFRQRVAFLSPLFLSLLAIFAALITLRYAIAFDVSLIDFFAFFWFSLLMFIAITICRFRFDAAAFLIAAIFAAFDFLRLRWLFSFCHVAFICCCLRCFRCFLFYLFHLRFLRFNTRLRLRWLPRLLRADWFSRHATAFRFHFRCFSRYFAFFAICCHYALIIYLLMIISWYFKIIIADSFSPAPYTLIRFSLSLMPFDVLLFSRCHWLRCFIALMMLAAYFADAIYDVDTCHAFHLYCLILFHTRPYIFICIRARLLSLRFFFRCRHYCCRFDFSSSRLLSYASMLRFLMLSFSPWYFSSITIYSYWCLYFSYFHAISLMLL